MDAAMMKKLFARWADIMVEKKDDLVRLDSVAGDGDLGLVMNDGFLAVSAAISASDETDLGKMLYNAGKTLNKSASSSMGTLISIGFVNAGKMLKGRTDLDNQGIAELIESVGEGIMNTGKAKEGEKTFLDAWLPASRAARENLDLPRPEFSAAIARAAEEGYVRATSMVARHGRIAFRGENSAGIEDPGAAVAMLLIQGIRDIYRQ